MSVSTEPGLEIGPVNCGKLLNRNEFMKYVVQIVNKERRSLKKIIILVEGDSIFIYLLIFDFILFYRFSCLLYFLRNKFTLVSHTFS